ncbi:hypothetical protein HMSSN139_18430 [Paenibacillus sp. HMSSN-139]|nr:hypothetical protein HMSSN139_18430 [Paenibacillus sp. HMSSN-139]
MAATLLGINAAVTHMKDSSFPVLFIISLAAGSLIGTALDIDGSSRGWSGVSPPRI